MINPAIQRAQLLYQQRRYDLAADALREALAADPSNALAHALLALCLGRQKKFAEATDAAQSAIVHEPDLAFAHYALGITLFERNRLPEAESAAREAVRLSPADADHWVLLGLSIYNQGRWADALDAADHALLFDAEHTDALNLRAMALVKLGRKDEAAHAISGALQRNPDNAASHANQGWTSLHQNDHKKALEHFREALRLDPNNEWAREGMIAALKARHLPYRLMLRYYLWMSRFRQRGQWLLIIGFYVGYQLLLQVQRANPAAAPYIIPILVAYVLFAWSSWVADPLFNFALLLSKFGRHLLTRRKSIGALLVVTGGLAALFFAALYFTTSHLFFLVVALLTAATTLSIATTTGCRENRAFWIMTAYTILATLTAIAGILLIPSNEDRGLQFLQAGLFALFFSSFASNILRSMILRR